MDNSEFAGVTGYGDLESQSSFNPSELESATIGDWFKRNVKSVKKDIGNIKGKLQTIIKKNKDGSTTVETNVPEVDASKGSGSGSGLPAADEPTMIMGMTVPVFTGVAIGTVGLLALGGYLLFGGKGKGAAKGASV